MDEKRKLRNSRKRRKRNAHACSSLKQELADERTAHQSTKDSNALSRNMARSFWERWRYELEERKKIQKINRELNMSLNMSVKNTIKSSRGYDLVPIIPSIDRSLLCDPIEFGEHPSDSDLFIGRGSFGVVKCQMYRGICVAVKEFLPHTLKDSVMKEARLLFELCHPYLPLLLGVCVSKFPYIHVVQYYGIGLQSITFRRELRECKFVSGYQTWIILCAQVIEAFRYLHNDVGLLHNDLKGDNVLITNCKQTGKKWPSMLTSLDLQIVLVDFGKATKLGDGKKYSLSLSEKQQYHLFHPYIAPELIDGLVRRIFNRKASSKGLSDRMQQGSR